MCLSNLYVDLLKDIQLATRVENRVLYIVNLFGVFHPFRLNLVHLVFMMEQPINDRVQKLLHKVPRFRLNIEPKQVE